MGEVLREGEAGTAGKAKYYVEVGGERVEYEDKFRLQIVEFTPAYREQDGVIEPGEYGTIQKIKIQNVGYMPSPIHQDLLI